LSISLPLVFSATELTSSAGWLRNQCRSLTPLNPNIVSGLKHLDRSMRIIYHQIEGMLVPFLHPIEQDLTYHRPSIHPWPFFFLCKPSLRETPKIEYIPPLPPLPLSFLASTASLRVAVMIYCGASWGRVERLGDGEEVACWRGLGWFFEEVVGMGWGMGDGMGDGGWGQIHGM